MKIATILLLVLLSLALIFVWAVGFTSMDSTSTLLGTRGNTFPAAHLRVITAYRILVIQNGKTCKVI
jgi:hypothetical protein